MKTLILLAVLCFGIAQAQDKKPKDINARKAKAISRIDERISIMQSKKSCINAASDKEALKACHKKHKAKMKSMRDEFKARRANRKKNRNHNHED